MLREDKERAQTVSLAESLTGQFYEWERRGRGWLIWDRPVDLEPPFEPFILHAPFTPRALDDGRKPTLMSRLLEALKGSETQYRPLDVDESSDRCREPAYMTRPTTVIEVPLGVAPRRYSVCNWGGHLRRGTSCREH